MLLGERSRRRRAAGISIVVFAAIAVAAAAVAQPPCCSGSGCCGRPLPDPCILTYGASGVVTDASSGLPIAGATVMVLDLPETLTDSDGRFTVRGSRRETCNVDYYFSLSITAPGYHGYFESLYTTAVLPSRVVALEPLDALPTATLLNATPTATPPTNLCPGDCDADRAIRVHELIIAVNVLLGRAPLPACASIDVDDSGSVSVDEVVHAVSLALVLGPLAACYWID